MFIDYLKKLNQDPTALDQTEPESRFDEDFFDQCLSQDPKQSLQLFKALHQKYLHDRQIAGLTLYYLGLAYNQLKEFTIANRYYHHLIKNYKDLPALYAKALRQIKEQQH